MGSSLARESDDIIYTQAGPEIGVASTKAYTAQIMIFQLLALHLGQVKGYVSDKEFQDKISSYQDIDQKINEALKLEDSIKKLAKEFVHCKSAFYIGRGYNFPNAMEGALKNKEISYMHAEGYAAGEMKHGPIALIDEEFLVVCICSSGHTFDKMVSNMKEVHARKGKISVITDRVTPELKEMCEYLIEVPEVIESLSPLVNVIPLQFFAYYLALERGTDIDKPRNLAKSVTVE